MAHASFGVARTHVGAAAVLGVALVALGSVGAGRTAAASPDAGAVEHARSLRAAVGLPSDLATVTASFARGGFDSKLSGIPLSDAEQRVFGDVVQAQTSLAPVASAAKLRPESTGAYYDGRALYLVSTNSETLKRSVEKLVPAGMTVHYVESAYSADDLDAVKAALVDEDIGTVDVAGAVIKSVYVNPRSGRVEVGVVGDAAGVRVELAERFGERVLVFEEAEGVGGLLACTVNDCGTKGGLTIVKGNVTCTSGFLVREIGDFQHSDFYLMTAGHCITDAGGLSNTTSWRNGANTLTYGTNVAYENRPTNDIGIIGDGPTPATRNQYYVGGGSVKSIVGESDVTVQVPGLVVCRNGAASDWDCGSIARSNIFFRYQMGYTFNNYWEVRMASDYGDSGAGMVVSSGSSYTAAGILSGGESRSGVSYTYYNPTQWDIWGVNPRSFNLKICATASC